MKRSYMAVVERVDIGLKPGQLLLGGVTANRSSRFETREMATDWALTIVDGNLRTGKVNGLKVKILYSDKEPEILAEEMK